MSTADSSLYKQFQTLSQLLSSRLSGKRFLHCERVSAMARHISAHLGYSLKVQNQAAITGLLHDVCRELSESQLLKEARKCGLRIDAFARANPGALHGPVGACWVAEHFGVKDALILKAIAAHTFGRSRMSYLDKIIFIADYIEDCRTHPHADKVRQAIFRDKNLNRAVVIKAQGMLEYSRRNDWMVPQSILTLAKRS
jgi:predicted HD superfamily hydrolase involved in NAD metabolism